MPFKTRMRNWFKKVDNFVNKALFPDKIKCVFCNRDIPNFDEKPYCEECEKDIPFNNGSKCLICSEPIENEATVCDSCQLNKRHFKRAFCPFVYKDRVRSAILSYKDSNRRYLAPVFAKFIAKEIEESGVKIDVLSFVPLSKKKQKSRGFNQAELLAEQISKLLQVPVVPLFEKIKDTKTQKTSSFKERQENTNGMYALLSGVKLKRSQNVLIVDDVITTGATIDACCRLICKKVANIYVASVARNKFEEKKQPK